MRWQSVSGTPRNKVFREYYLKRLVEGKNKQQAIPFRVSAQVPNAVTLAALAEGGEMLKDPAAPRFSSAEALFED